MELFNKRLGSKRLTNILNDIYTVPSNTTTRITKMVISNGDVDGRLTVKHYVASLNQSFNLFNKQYLSANGRQLDFDCFLHAGDKIQALAEITTDADILIYGQEQV